jgi:AraC family transcriptional regulator of adaptative response/methylated-DNA-[protein]-cysteine methyltransferase
MTPATYAKGGRGARIVYAIVDSPLDRLLVAMTGFGVCFVCLGEDDGVLTRALEAEFPAAEAIERDDQAVAPAVELLVAFLDDGTPPLGLPLDIRATAFQRRVWQELITIPCGETRTYSEIAETLGLPRGQRAVARACATNPVALAVPCHRVVGADGSLRGYRWGQERKQALLDREKESDLSLSFCELGSRDGRSRRRSAASSQAGPARPGPGPQPRHPQAPARCCHRDADRGGPRSHHDG